MHANLREFQMEAHPSYSSPEVKAATYAFGLIALGKFILLLPAEVLEDELPRLKGTLTSVINLCLPY
jgi:CLIP-associating protein 1/2